MASSHMLLAMYICQDCETKSFRQISRLFIQIEANKKSTLFVICDYGHDAQSMILNCQESNVLTVILFMSPRKHLCSRAQENFVEVNLLPSIECLEFLVKRCGVYGDNCYACEVWRNIFLENSLRGLVVADSPNSTLMRECYLHSALPVLCANVMLLSFPQCTCSKMANGRKNICLCYQAV